MGRITSRVYNTVAISVGLAFIFLIAAIKHIEEKHDPEYFWE